MNVCNIFHHLLSPLIVERKKKKKEISHNEQMKEFKRKKEKSMNHEKN